MNRLFLWAHRGASQYAPENTMAAFTAAVDCGADGIELDIHLSRDGVPVVVHDETLERTTDGNGRVDAASWEELRQLDAGGWYSQAFAGEPLPGLEQVLAVFAGKLRLNLELKKFDAGLAVLELLASFAHADILVSSFNHRLLERLRQQNASLPLAVLYEEGSWYKSVALASDLGALAFHPRADLVTRPMVSRCHDVGLSVYPWTVDDPVLIRELQRAGVDGIFSNNPLKARTASFQ